MTTALDEQERLDAHTPGSGANRAPQAGPWQGWQGRGRPGRGAPKRRDPGGVASRLKMTGSLFESIIYTR